MPDAERFNADQLAFWDGKGGHTWVARQSHTDTTLAPVTDALLRAAAARPGEQVLDIGCGCGAATLDIARAVAPGGRVMALDISGPMIAEGRRRSQSAGLDNIDWMQADAASVALTPYDLLLSCFGVMFFGDPVSAFSHLRRAAAPDARMIFACWAPLAENKWMHVPMQAVTPHLPPRPAGDPNAPGMFAFADPGRVADILVAAGWAEPQFEKLECRLDIAAGKGLEEAIVQSTQIGAVSSWLRDQPADIIDASVASLRESLGGWQEGPAVRLPAAVWLVTSTPA